MMLCQQSLTTLLSYKLSSKARVKRLATSPAKIITSCAEKNLNLKAASLGKATHKQNVRSRRMTRTNGSSKSSRLSLQDIENRFLPYSQNRKARKKTEALERYEDEEEEKEEEEEEEESVDTDANNESKEDLTKQQDVNMYLLFPNADCSSLESAKLDRQCIQGRSGSQFQMVTIVPSAVNEDGEVSYRLLVQDCPVETDEAISTSENTDDSKVKNDCEPENHKMPKHSKRNLQNDDVSDDDNPTMKCTFCNYTTQKRYLLSRHLRAHMEQHAFRCDLCPCSFKTPLSLQNHINTHKGICPFRCRECDDSFTVSGDLVFHVNQCHSTGVKYRNSQRHHLYHCPLCRYSCQEDSLLKRHLSLHTNRTQYVCDVCDACFADCRQLVQHRCVHMDNNSDLLHEDSCEDVAYDNEGSMDEDEVNEENSSHGRDASKSTSEDDS